MSAAGSLRRRVDDLRWQARTDARAAAWRVSPKAVSAVRYLRHRRRIPSFARPSDLSEIILGQIVSGEVLKYAPYTDKLAVRDHWTRWGFADLLPELYGAWDDPDEIDFDQLPERYFLKANNGWESHFRSTPESPLDPAPTRVALRRVMDSPMDFAEPHYALIPPRCFAEQLIGDGITAPVDYKFTTVGGRVNGILVCSDRELGTTLSLHGPDWEIIPGGLIDTAITPLPPEPPAQLGFMLEVAADIGSRFPHVRVDMYAPNPQETYLSELTFTASRGYLVKHSTDALRRLARGWTSTPAHPDSVRS